MRTASLTRDDTVANYITTVYMWMTAGLGITGATAYAASLHPEFCKFTTSTGPFLLMFVLEIVLIIMISAFASSVRESASGVGAALMAGVLFSVFTMLNGLMLSGLFFIYTLPSLGLTFGMTAGLFGIMTLYGFVTKTDLSSLGNILFMCLLGLIAALLVNMYMGSTWLQYLITTAGLLIFTLYTAYDTQQIKQEAGSNPSAAEAICAALGIYLDFINLFLYMLEIFGKKNDD